MKQTEFTLQRLKEALNRLKEGKPEYTKADGKISILRINNEASLSRGAIYYYKDFVKQAKAEIQIYNENKQQLNVIDGLEPRDGGLERLRQSRNKEKQLKEKYREELKNFKNLSDEVVQQNVSLAFRLMEMQDERRQIEVGKIIPIHK